MKTLGSVLVLLATMAASAGAQDVAVRVHGFGSWSFGRTDVNTFLGGTPDGRGQTGAFALNVASDVSPRLTISSQVFWRVADEATETEVDYAFAQWQVSDALRLVVGKVKQPFGLYTEIFDVGTLRPFVSLPQSMYGPLAFVAEGYVGAGLRGRWSPGAWGLDVDGYAGSIGFNVNQVAHHFLAGEPVLASDASTREVTTDLLGGHLVLRTPVPGLRIGASGFTGRHVEGAEVERHSVRAGSLEYLASRWWVRAELAHSQEGDAMIADARYAEVAAFLDRRWQVAARWDWGRLRLVGVDVSAAPSLTRHRELAAGLNLWLAPQLVAKASYHVVDGNRLAAPEAADLAATIAAGGLAHRTRLLQFGGQFSF